MVTNNLIVRPISPANLWIEMFPSVLTCCGSLCTNGHMGKEVSFHLMNNYAKKIPKFKIFWFLLYKTILIHGSKFAALITRDRNILSWRCCSLVWVYDLWDFSRFCSFKENHFYFIVEWVFILHHFMKLCTFVTVRDSNLFPHSSHLCA